MNKAKAKAKAKQHLMNLLDHNIKFKDFDRVLSSLVKNAFLHFFQNVKKHIHEAKISSPQLLALWIFFIFWIRIKTLDSYFFRYSKHDLERF